ncbi:uncharacterized protein LOC141559514 [Sminthopsis crassicaudata]|uniref:uncharacterized protein LOC141559514 n=1 Tax=Sminthopsis crassicaudata TaxID=9301 RepID=UPI003D687CAA
MGRKPRMFPKGRVTAPFSSSHLDDSSLHTIQWAKALLGPEYFPKIPQTCECQMHLPYLNQKPTLLPVTDQCFEIPQWPQAWPGTTLACSSSQDKALLLHSKNETGTITSLSQSFSHSPKAIMTPLPSLNQGPRARAMIISELIPWVQVSTSKISQDNMDPRVTTSLQCPDHPSVIRTGSSLQNNHYSTFTAICPPHPKYLNNFISSESGRVTAIARASSGPNFLTKAKTLPSLSQEYPVQGRGGFSLPKGEVFLPCDNQIPEASLTSSYKFKTTSKPSPYPDLQANHPSPSDPCASAQVPSSLKKQVANAPETGPREKALPHIKCKITKVPLSKNQAELAPQQDKLAKDRTTCSGLPGSDLSFTVPSILKHPSEFFQDSTHQDIPTLVPRICANVSLIPCQEPSKALSPDNRTERKLRPDAQEKPLLSPKHKEEAILDPICGLLSPNAPDCPPSPSVGLDHQLTVPSTPIPSESSHQTTIISSTDCHTNDILKPSSQGTPKLANDHCESVPLEPPHQDILQPAVDHQAESTGNSHPEMTLQVFHFQWKTKTRTNKESQETQIAPLLDKDLHANPTEEYKNSQSKPVTAPEHCKTPKQSSCPWPMLAPHPSPEALKSCDNMAKKALSTNHPDEAQSTKQNKIQTLQNTEATWCFNHIKPYIIDGKVVIPAITVKNIITSIPQEKIKKDISKQILLRRMKGATRRPGRRILSSYRVCLACASWIPNGCPHIPGTKYSGQALLLVIPRPLPGSEEEMGLKFVLHLPHIKKSSIRNITPTVCTQNPSSVSPP